MHHDLKTYPAYYKAVRAGDKRFEIRWNDDRAFQKGDTVTLKEYDPKKINYTGREIDAMITYVTSYEQQRGYVVFGFVPIERDEVEALSA